MLQSKLPLSGVRKMDIRLCFHFKFYKLLFALLKHCFVMYEKYLTSEVKYMKKCIYISLKVRGRKERRTWLDERM